jgi:hypothetical protein
LIDERVLGFVTKSALAIFKYNYTSYLPVIEPRFLLISKGSTQGHHMSTFSTHVIFLRLKTYGRADFLCILKCPCFRAAVLKNNKSLANEERKYCFMLKPEITD